MAEVALSLKFEAKAVCQPALATKAGAQSLVKKENRAKVKYVSIACLTAAERRIARHLAAMCDTCCSHRH